MNIIKRIAETDYVRSAIKDKADLSAFKKKPSIRVLLGISVIGLSYMMGGTGGYLVGYVLATLALGLAARRGWDRSVLMMAVAMLIGNALIYVPGLLWLRTMTDSWSQTLAWGLTPFVIADLIKLGLAALIVPGLWKLIGSARS